MKINIAHKAFAGTKFERKSSEESPSFCIYFVFCSFNLTKEKLLLLCNYTTQGPYKIYKPNVCRAPPSVQAFLLSFFPITDSKTFWLLKERVTLSKERRHKLFWHEQLLFFYFYFSATETTVTSGDSRHIFTECISRTCILYNRIKSSFCMYGGGSLRDNLRITQNALKLMNIFQSCIFNCTCTKTNTVH
jgi:hypothetical protein